MAADETESVSNGFPADLKRKQSHDAFYIRWVQTLRCQLLDLDKAIRK